MLDLIERSAAAVLLLGPLYHLTDRTERVKALVEARRVLQPLSQGRGREQAG